MTAPFPVDVILVNWNTAEMTVRAIRSVCNAAIAEGIPARVVVVDNGSWDDSVDRIRAEAPSVTVVENGRNLGFARAVNRGLTVSPGGESIVLLLNTDAVLEPGALTALVEAFANNPEVGIVGANLRNEDGSAQNTAAPFPSLATELLNKALLKIIAPEKYRGKVGDGETELRDVDSVIGAALAVRSDAIEIVGVLDERFFFFFEETDWCLRVRASGRRVVIAPKFRVEHGQGKSSQSVLPDVRIEYYRSRYRYFRKNKGLVQAGFLLAGLMVKLPVETLSALLVTAVTFGQSAKPRRRLSVVSKVLAWHLLGCPRSWGLEGRWMGKGE